MTMEGNVLTLSGLLIAGAIGLHLAWLVSNRAKDEVTDIIWFILLVLAFAGVCALLANGPASWGVVLVYLFMLLVYIFMAVVKPIAYSSESNYKSVRNWSVGLGIAGVVVGLLAALVEIYKQPVQM